MEMKYLGRRVRSECSWLSTVSRCTQILLVDHNPVSLVNTASLLQEQLYNVTTAQSAGLALKYFEARKGLFDIVMADFHIADMNIYQFIQCIRDRCLRGIPIILMAEDDPMDLGEDAVQKGACYITQKPLTPIDVAYLWQHIVHMTGRIPGVTSTEQEKKAFTRSYQGKGKRRKIQNTECGVTFAEAGQSKTSNMRNDELGYLGSSSDLQKDNGGKGPQGIHTTPEIIQQSLNKINSNIALNATTKNIIMSTRRVQVTGKNGEFGMERDQLTHTNVCMTRALQISQQKGSGDLGGGIYFNENTSTLGNLSTGSHQVVGGNQLILEGEQVTRENGYVKGAIQVPNQEASGDLGGEIYCNANRGHLNYMNTGQSTSNLHNTTEEELTLDDIAELVRYIQESDWTVRAEANSSNHQQA